MKPGCIGPILAPGGLQGGIFRQVSGRSEPDCLSTPIVVAPIILSKTRVGTPNPGVNIIMGVSISMRPGTIMRSKGGPIDITPGWRSQAAMILQERYGQCPCEINADDLYELEWAARASSVHSSDSENFWKKIVDAVREHHSVVIDTQY